MAAVELKPFKVFDKGMSYEERKRLLEKDPKFVYSPEYHRCQRCGRVAYFLIFGKHKQYVSHGHHVVPIFRGGSNTPDNIVVLCPECHMVVHKEAGDRVYKLLEGQLKDLKQIGLRYE